MSDLIAGNSFVKAIPNNEELLNAVHTNSILDAVNSNGINGVQTTQNVGLSADATAQRGFNHVDGTAQRMAIAELDAINKVGEEVCDSSRDSMAATERLGLENLRASDRAGDRSVASTERFGLFNNGSIERNADKTQSTVERTSYKTQDEVEKFGFRELEAINSSERTLYAGMSQNAKDILLFNANEFERVKLQAAADTASIKQQQYDDTKQLLLQNCHDTDKIIMQSANQFKDILLQNCNDTASIKMQAELHAKDAALTARDLMHQADKNTAAIQIESLKNKEELARQIAECCCENKSLILETSHKTEDLIRKLDEQRIRDELARTREELMALRIRSTLTPAPIASVPL